MFSGVENSTYLIAKRFEAIGYVAVITKHRKVLPYFIRKLLEEIRLSSIQLIASHPNAYEEYEPYKIMESM